MAILTLTTDLGMQDHYVGVIKGSILSLAPTAQLVDISHAVPSFDVYQAANLIKKSFYYFPEKSIHLIGVNPVSEDVYPFIAALYRNHYFIGADSGMFSGIFDEAPQQIVQLDGKRDPKLKTFSLLDLPVKAAAKLLNGAKLADLGTKQDNYKQAKFFIAYDGPNSIDGYVAHIDKFKNVITNVSKEMFEKAGKNRPFEILFKSYTINKINSHYEDEISGEAVAFFNFQEMLEIAINAGDAATLLNFGKNEKIKIQFHDS